MIREEQELHRYWLKCAGLKRGINLLSFHLHLYKRDIFKANQIVVVATLFTFFSKVLVAHHSEETTEFRLAKVLGVNPFFVKDYQQAMCAFPLIKVISIIHHLRLADLQAKGVDIGQASEGQILKASV